MDCSVLVVEDEPFVRLDTVCMLEEAGMSVIEFDDASEALSYAQAHGSEVAAIFTDINLRGPMDGVELATAIADTVPGIALLVTSGAYIKRPNTLPPEVEFIKKPWLPLHVLTKMQAAIERRRDGRPSHALAPPAL